MSTITNTHSRTTIRQILRILAPWALLTCCTYGQVNQGQTSKPADTSGKVSDAIANARQDNPESIYWVEQIAQARAVQAIPMLEEKFDHTQDALDKAHIASALVRLGDRNDLYWDFLVKQATQSVENDAPNFMSYDSQGKAVPGPSPEFAAWAKARHSVPEAMAEQQVYLAPGPVALLGLTGDPRAIPVLRRGLLSPNYQIQIVAAMALAEIGDKESVPFIIDTCRRAPADAAAVIARSLVYFDDPEAQSAVDQYIPKDAGKLYREDRARGKKPLSN